MFSKVIKSCNISIGTPYIVEENFDVEESGNVLKENTLDYKDSNESEANESESNFEMANVYAKSILEEAEKKAKLIITEAERKAADILDKAEKERIDSKKAFELAKKKGYEEGYNEGYKIGYDESIRIVKNEYEQELKDIRSIKENALMEYKELLEGAEEEVLNLIIDIAKRVINKELTNRETLLGIIKDAFEKCLEEKEATLCLSPDDYDYYSERIGELKQIAGKVINLHLKRDSSLKPGGCVIETSHGSINASVENKIKKIEEAFKAAVGDT